MRINHNMAIVLLAVFMLNKAKKITGIELGV